MKTLAIRIAACSALAMAEAFELAGPLRLPMSCKSGHSPMVIAHTYNRPNPSVGRCDHFRQRKIILAPNNSRRPIRCILRMSSKEDTSIKTKPENSAAPANETEAISPYAWVVAILLLVVNIHNQWTRALVYYLVSFKAPDTPESNRLYMNKDLSFGEEQYAVLASFGFTALFTLFSLGAGRLADKTNRAYVVAGSAAAWSIATAIQAMSTSFDAVLGARALTGISQAFLNPQAFGLLAEYFPESRRATANGIFTAGVYLGGALASLSILLDERLGWRAAATDIGLIGGALALLCAVVLRDPRFALPAAPVKLAGGDDGTDAAASSSSAALVTAAAASAASPAARDKEDAPSAASLSTAAEKFVDGLRSATGAAGEVLGSRFVQLLFTASALRFCAGYGIGVWKGPLYRELFPGFEEQFSVTNAFVISAGGVLSSIIGSAIADRYGVTEPRARLWVPAVGSLLAVPFWIGACEAGDFYTSMSLLFMEYVVAECWFGPTIASLYKVPRGKAEWKRVYPPNARYQSVF